MNVKKLLIKYLSEHQLEILMKTGLIAKELNMTLYLVGGAVRDILIEEKPDELDLIIDGDLENFIKKLEEELEVKISKTSKFMTMTTIIENIKFDIARARNESYTPKGSLPSVSPSNIKNDILRRDFTINSICINLSPREFGQIYDQQNGLKDIKNKTIRIIHNESFLDDPTRIFRAIRFSKRLNFKIEKKTEELIKKHCETLIDLSPSRVLNELKKISKEINPYIIFKELDEKNILSLISPLISLKNNQHDVEKLKKLSKFSDSLEFWMNILIKTNNLTEIKQICLRLKLTKKIENQLISRDNLNEIIGNWKLKKYFENPPVSQIQKISTKILLLEYSMTKNLKRKEILSFIIENISKAKPILTGKDLLSIGIRDGKSIGFLLTEIMKKRFLGFIVSKDDEINYVKSNIKINS
jgi:tRNA nucleotidyltransferase (CCA-adding enzyme)